MLVPRPHLTVLFNALWDTDRREIPVSHPSDVLGTLCTIHLEDGGRATVEFLDDREYADRRSTVAERYGEPAITEVPDRRSFVAAFLAGGLLDVPNRATIDAFLERHGSPDLTAGHRPVLAGFDTNLMPWRIGDVLGLRPAEGVVNGYVLATGVRDELVWSHKRKDTRSLEDAFGAAFAALWNQPRGPDREGRLGETYYRRLRDRRTAEEIETDTGDPAIVAGYDAYQQDGRKEVLLFSDDRDFVELARSHRILAQRVTLPDTLPGAVTVDLARVQDALFHLAVLFGVLEVPTTTLYGVWRGKGGTAWHDDLLRLECRSPPVASAIERDLAIIEAYSDRP